MTNWTLFGCFYFEGKGFNRFVRLCKPGTGFHKRVLANNKENLNCANYL